jgi:hypothetical protein
MTDRLVIVSVKCVCGGELFKISTNVAGLSTKVKCKQCGIDNVFDHALTPKPDRLRGR